MTATITAEKRRPSPTPPRPLRELPVLFHLMDVSRPRGYAAPPPAFSLGSLTDPAETRHESPLASSLRGDPPNGAAESFDLETAAELVQTKAYGSLPIEAPISVSPPPDEPPIADSEGAAMNPVSIDSIAETFLDTPPPAADEAVNLRQRAEDRQRKRQEGKRDDWFTTQGKFIVVGFVIALIVTIYVARTRRKLFAPPVAVKPHAHPGDAASSAKSSPVKQAVAVETAKITNIRPTDKSTANEPKTALHPPTIPQIAEQPAATKSSADTTLFTFSKRPEERVATRTDATAGTAPDATAPQPGLPPAPTSPTLQPQYPSTNYPSTYQPVAPPPAYAPPPVNAPAPVYAPPPAGAPSGPALNPAASSMPLYPTTNTASGNRYERTGSGLY
jgi:hypothetical protein